MQLRTNSSPWSEYACWGTLTSHIATFYYVAYFYRAMLDEIWQIMVRYFTTISKSFEIWTLFSKKYPLFFISVNRYYFLNVQNKSYFYEKGTVHSYGGGTSRGAATWLKPPPPATTDHENLSWHLPSPDHELAFMAVVSSDAAIATAFVLSTLMWKKSRNHSLLHQEGNLPVRASMMAY